MIASVYLTCATLATDATLAKESLQHGQQGRPIFSSLSKLAVYEGIQGSVRRDQD
jgi:hypothetical protein